MTTAVQNNNGQLYSGLELLAGLDIPIGASGVFGIAYSILTAKGIAKGAEASIAGVKKVGSKIIEDGHATSFMIDVQSGEQNGTIDLTGISDKGWEFSSDFLDDAAWARKTDSANTDVYYKVIDGTEIQNFNDIKEELDQKKDVTYSELMPNIPGASITYQNCISSSHYISYRMGYSSWVATKGAYMPSLSNWMTWLGTIGSDWQYKRFEATNTHIPKKYR